MTLFLVRCCPSATSLPLNVSYPRLPQDRKPHPILICSLRLRFCSYFTVYHQNFTLLYCVSLVLYFTLLLLYFTATLLYSSTPVLSFTTTVLPFTTTVLYYNKTVLYFTITVLYTTTTVLYSTPPYCTLLLGPLQPYNLTRLGREGCDPLGVGLPSHLTFRHFWDISHRSTTTTKSL